MGSRGRLLLIAVIAFAAAAAGVFVARTVMDTPRKSESEVHALLHDQLKLDAAQSAKIEALEARHAMRKKALELEMRAANARLAEAIQAEHGYGPKVTEAVDHVHHVMGEMQKEVLEHLFAMRAVLDPEQASIFDRTVVKALTAEAR
ncbi:heavy metal resistance protein [Sphingopyxis sp. H050]|nr:periplasmic heavy metal sensor [Sphingopyxis sp. H050]KTE20785.1 heavy metal resistance protein [Sphingopyxis sp. H050]